MMCTMSTEFNQFFPAHLIIVSILSFIIYILYSKLIAKKTSWLAIGGLFILGLFGVIILIKLFSVSKFSMCYDGCVTSCPLCWHMPIITYFSYTLFGVVYLLLLYIFILKMKSMRLKTQ